MYSNDQLQATAASPSASRQRAAAPLPPRPPPPPAPPRPHLLRAPLGLTAAALFPGLFDHQNSFQTANVSSQSDVIARQGCRILPPELLRIIISLIFSVSLAVIVGLGGFIFCKIGPRRSMAGRGLSNPTSGASGNHSFNDFHCFVFCGCWSWWFFL